jgi:heat shock protein HslJ
MKMKTQTWALPLAAMLLAVPTISALPQAPAARAAETPAAANKALAGTQWELTAPTYAGLEKRPFLKFADTTLSASVGLNSISGGYTLKGNTISLQPLASTRMAGPEPMMNAEDSYGKALQRVRSFAVSADGRRLTLYGVQTLSFRLTGRTAATSSASQGRVTLREGQTVKLKLADTLRSNGSKTGDKIRFYVAEDILGPNGKKLVFKGARAGGTVTEVRRARRLGRKGVLTFSVDYLVAIDGTRVPLRTEKVKSSNNARRRLGIGAAAIALSPAALLFRGRNVTVKPGTIVEAYIDRRAEIRTQDRPASGAARAMLATPPAIVTEHEHLHHDLNAAIASGGKTAERAREVAALLQPHFEAEEAYAMPPLGLLEALAWNKPIDDATATEAIKMAERLRHEYDDMLREHKELTAALHRLEAAAKEENKPNHAAFADALVMHAQQEEQVLYPTALLIGDYLKMKKSKK